MAGDGVRELEASNFGQRELRIIGTHPIRLPASNLICGGRITRPSVWVGWVRLPI